MNIAAKLLIIVILAAVSSQACADSIIFELGTFDHQKYQYSRSSIERVENLASIWIMAKGYAGKFIVDCSSHTYALTEGISRANGELKHVKLAKPEFRPIFEDKFPEAMRLLLCRNI